ncbi:hypothetical protein [Nitrosomonas sp. Nm58]|uniref:hypothetical protein n=1 Tax=Nitrosomonas sp. Nm58 TaxID=200126 RepID=UPI00089532C5|nr:hypothetical protein [Nitrosomonas sp. Nm58]SDY06505.1 hypothetical protein SAMN05421754_1001241 [Nitrosomonas sp. Nm58]
MSELTPALVTLILLAALVLAVDGGGNQTIDPGCVLITGKWKNMGRFKGPVLCSVASRPPYFHDG